MKKTWMKPKLISLYRGKPEEAVLSTCKDSGQNGPVSNDCTGGGQCHDIVES